ncbi:nuclease-related domain-containing protein [Pleurocapsa sp. PCC 7319]|uniref:nuclease-related domain-containing protein n=1 Tax=Pleurocapsa sp. PCC 7319 TaxID=118161 RepID=UPI0003755727|nr:nuclease-related domain-containing protein [Pleurocapsa sp. PCC 7319]
MRLFKQKKLRDIDIVATSPENNCFVIELKSHFGNVKWNSKFKQLRRQLGKNPKYAPFRKNLINQVKTQADKLKKHRNLTQMPDKILLFSQARIKLDRARGKRLKSKVIISYPSQLVNDLKGRNQELIEKKNARNANSRRP